MDTDLKPTESAPTGTAPSRTVLLRWLPLLLVLFSLPACSWRAEVREMADYGHLLRSTDPWLEGIGETISLTNSVSDMHWRAYGHHLGPEQTQTSSLGDFFRLLYEHGESDEVFEFFRLLGR